MPKATHSGTAVAVLDLGHGCKEVDDLNVHIGRPPQLARGGAGVTLKVPHTHHLLAHLHMGGRVSSSVAAGKAYFGPKGTRQGVLPEALAGLHAAHQAVYFVWWHR